MGAVTASADRPLGIAQFRRHGQLVGVVSPRRIRINDQVVQAPHALIVAQNAADPKRTKERLTIKRTAQPAVMIAISHVATAATTGCRVDHATDRSQPRWRRSRYDLMRRTDCPIGSGYGERRSAVMAQGDVPQCPTPWP
jgi:hypothetical protein